MDEFETLLTSSRIAVDRWLKAHIITILIGKENKSSIGEPPVLFQVT